MRAIWERKQRFREVGFDLRAVAEFPPDGRSITVIGVPLGDKAADDLALELVTAVREMLAEVVREFGVDPSDVKIEDARSREEWFGGPSI